MPFSIRSWQDVMAILAIISVLAGGFAWLMKLDLGLSGLRLEHERRLNYIEVEISDGILPRADERLRSAEQRIRDLERRLYQRQEEEC